MKIYEITTHSTDETMALAYNLGKLLSAGDVITIEGELGAGKTVFTKGIASGMAIEEMITSPTFTIIKEYEGNPPLYHMDAYRLENSEEDIGFHEYFHGSGVTVVEWAQFIESYLPKDLLNIEIIYIDENSRMIKFTPVGEHFQGIMNQFHTSV